MRRIQKPCIGYKILGAGRIDPVMAFEHAFEHIKPGDVVNVGIAPRRQGQHGGGGRRVGPRGTHRPTGLSRTELSSGNAVTD